MPPFFEIVRDAAPAEHVEPSSETSLGLAPAENAEGVNYDDDVFRQIVRSCGAASGGRGIWPASLDPDRVDIFIRENARSLFRPAHRSLLSTESWQNRKRERRARDRVLMSKVLIGGVGLIAGKPLVPLIR